MTTEIIFPKGFNAFKPNESAPDFVKAEISIEPRAFFEFMKEHKDLITDKGYFRITIKEGREGKYYPQVNTWKPEQKPQDHGINPEEVDPFGTPIIN